MSGIEKLRNLQALFDGDAILHRVGWACQKKGEDGEVVVEPIENCLHSVKLLVKGVFELFHPEKEHRIFIGGEGNFRYDIATIQPYKGNRTQPKPEHYEAIREYLITYWNAEVVDGMEADDKVSMIQWETKDKSTCIVGVDKDLLNTPGHHWNWVKKEYTYQSLADANVHFLHQLITGDRTDNIRGIDGYGEVRAAKLIAKCKGNTPEIKKEISQLYKQQHGNKWASALDETARLLWLHRDPSKKWNEYL